MQPADKTEEVKIIAVAGVLAVTVLVGLPLLAVYMIREAMNGKPASNPTPNPDDLVGKLNF